MTTNRKRPIGIGIIGMGFMGQTHAKAFLKTVQEGAPAKLVAVCDPDPGRRSGLGTGTGNMAIDHGDHLFDPSEVSGYERAADLMADDSIDLVSICTHTDTHVELAGEALRAGKHALVEKPVSIHTDEILGLMQLEDGSPGWCIPAMCVRHWPGWLELAEIVRSGQLGSVRHALFERLGSVPRWAGEFYSDETRSGGAAFDLHVHDVDFARWLFGDPDEVSAIGDASHIVASYRYKAGATVVVRGGWMREPAFPFSMSFLVEFERGVVRFNSSPSPVMSIFENGTMREVRLSDESGYERQAATVIRALCEGSSSRLALPNLEDALCVTRLIRRELDSAAAV